MRSARSTKAIRGWDASMTMHALRLAPCPDEAHEFFDFMAGAAAGCSTDRPLQTDNGIRGVRGEPRRLVHSTVCWVALDRAASLARQLDAEDRVPSWFSAAAAIRTAVQTQGGDPGLGAFTPSFGHIDLVNAAWALSQATVPASRTD